MVILFVPHVLTLTETENGIHHVMPRNNALRYTFIKPHKDYISRKPTQGRRSGVTGGNPS